MGSLSNPYEIIALRAIFGDDHAVVIPDDMWLGLFSIVPTDSAFGTEFAIGTGAYARVQVPNDDTNWQIAVAPVSNLLVLTFPTVTVDWGTTAGWALLDHVSATALANIVVYGTWAVPKTCQTGETPRVPIGGLTIGAD